MADGESKAQWQSTDQAVPEHTGTKELLGVRPNTWTKYLVQTYMQRQTPILKTVDVNKIVELAREKMKDNMGVSHIM